MRLGGGECGGDSERGRSKYPENFCPTRGNKIDTFSFLMLIITEMYVNRSLTGVGGCNWWNIPSKLLEKRKDICIGKKDS